MKSRALQEALEEQVPDSQTHRRVGKPPSKAGKGSATLSMAYAGWAAPETLQTPPAEGICESKACSFSLKLSALGPVRPHGSVLKEFAFTDIKLRASQVASLDLYDLQPGLEKPLADVFGPLEPRRPPGQVDPGRPVVRPHLVSIWLFKMFEMFLLLRAGTSTEECVATGRIKRRLELVFMQQKRAIQHCHH